MGKEEFCLTDSVSYLRAAKQNRELAPPAGSLHYYKSKLKTNIWKHLQNYNQLCMLGFKVINMHYFKSIQLDAFWQMYLVSTLQSSHITFPSSPKFPCAPLQSNAWFLSHEYQLFRMSYTWNHTVSMQSFVPGFFHNWPLYLIYLGRDSQLSVASKIEF